MGESSLILSFFLWGMVAVALSWLSPVRWQTLAITLCGIGFMGQQAPLSLLALSTATIVTFLVARHHANQRLLLPGCIGIISAGYLAFMLYAPESGEGISATLILPLGMAYYTLRLIHYLFESYKGMLRTHGFGDYLCYQFFPATLLIGPIHRFDEFTRDLRRKRWDPELFSAGSQRVIYGLTKVIVLGNYLIGVKLQPWILDLGNTPGLEGTYYSALFFWLQLYVLFSGFSDVAIGLAAMMGFRIRENFNWPFLARNISDFWKRWHMSLSSWCRDYVYTPALASGRSHAVAVLSSMVVLGLWHEPSLRYILWGAYHGLGITAYRAFSSRISAYNPIQHPAAGLVWHPIAVLITVHFVIFSFPITQSIEHWLLRL